MSWKTIFLSLGFTRTQKAWFKLILLLSLSAAFVAYSLSRLESTTGTPLKPFRQSRKAESHYATDEPSHFGVSNDLAWDPPLLDVPSPLLGLKESTLLKRLLSPGEAIAKGRWLLCNVDNYDTADSDYPRQSIFNDPADFEKYGWVHESFPTDGENILKTLSSALEGLGLPSNLDDYVISYDLHINEYEDNNHQKVKGTGAYFSAIYNADQACLMIINSRSPANTPKVQHLGYPVPPLKQLSDDIFLNWIRLAGPDRNRIAGLKYVFRCNVANDDTKNIVVDVESRIGHSIGDWPGEVFQITDTDVNQRDGLAILGTPNGAGVAYLLFQHKEYFPKKTISKVRVWRTPPPPSEPGEEPSLQLLFYIEDIPPAPSSSAPSSPPRRRRCWCF